MPKHLTHNHTQLRVLIALLVLYLVILKFRNSTLDFKNDFVIKKNSNARRFLYSSVLN